jgi:small conductance mechanosensitive channel
VLDNINQWLAANGLAVTLPQIVGSAMRLVLIVLIGWLVLRFLTRSIAGIGQHIVKHRESPGSVRRTKTLTRVMSNVASVAVFVIVILIILGEFGISVAPILGAAGVVGIAVGFGAQTLVKDFFTGFFLLLEDQIRTGDVVTVGGLSGVVEDFNLRSVKLRDYEGNVHFVPNSNITTVTNMSRDFAFAVMDIGVGYGEDTDKVIGVLRAVASEMQKDPATSTSIREDLEVAGVNALADSSVVIRCRIKVNALDQWMIKREFLARTKKSFDTHGIEIPFPHMRVLSSKAG